MEYTEDEIRDTIMEVLYKHLGIQGTWRGDGKTSHFKIENVEVRAECAAEQSLGYHLPNRELLTHKSDILLTISCKEATAGECVSYVSIEIKHKSAVTDQFKCRTYDMLHLKQQFGSRLLGVLVFVRAKKGISFRQAEIICYPFDKFIRIEHTQMQTPSALNELIASISDVLHCREKILD